MDPVTLLWICTLLGAAGFAATGYWYGRMKVAEEVAAAEDRAKGDRPSRVHVATTVPPPAAAPVADTPEAVAKAKEEGREEARKELEAERAALVETATKAAEEKVAEDRAALEAQAAEERAAAEDAIRQLAALREELRVEILARTEAEKRAADLTSRLVSSSQQVAALRARAGMTPEAPAVRNSMTPAPPRASMPPSMSPQRIASLAPGLFGELEDLRREVARLKSENESLRVAAFVKRQE